MEVWYIARYRWALDAPITRKEFARSTDKMLIDKHGNKHAKETTYEMAFLTWEGAKAFLIEEAETRVKNAEAELERERKVLAGIQALTNPEEGTQNEA